MTIASDIEVLARFGRALADPIRCRILLALCQAPAHPAELADALGISRTRLSNHLACLRDCGLVVTVPVGRRTRYELADERLGHALDDLRTALGPAPAPVTPSRSGYGCWSRPPSPTTCRGDRRHHRWGYRPLHCADGFGLDSVIEVSSAAAVAWQFSGRDHAVREAREKTILRIIAAGQVRLVPRPSTSTVSGRLAGTAARSGSAYPAQRYSQRAGGTSSRPRAVASVYGRPWRSTGCPGGEAAERVPCLRRTCFRLRVWPSSVRRSGGPASR